MTDTTESTAGRRLEGRRIILTGAAGNIGSHITRHLLREGAKVVLNGRTAEKLSALEQELINEGFTADNITCAAGDCAVPKDCEAVVAHGVEKFGGIDVLVNNAGGAGPKQTLENIPFSEEQKTALEEGETLLEASMNLIGGPWNMTRAALPHLSTGASVVNISTIFSRTPYFGRIPYVVPKSGLNALSLGLARELGPSLRAVRVNTVFPGPIKSERIDTVFAAMDRLQNIDAGSTSKQFRELMTNKTPAEEGDLAFRYPTPENVADTITWLASKESSGLSGHSLEVTNGMKVPAQSRFKLVSWPDSRLVDLSDRVILIVGGDDPDDAIVFARRNVNHGAQVILCFRTLDAVGRARVQLASGEDRRIQLQYLNPLRPESMDHVFEMIADQFGKLDGAIYLPGASNGAYGYSLASTEDSDVEGFIDNEMVAPVAFAASLSQRLASWPAQDAAPAVTFVTNPHDGQQNRLNDISRAGIEALIRVWRLESERQHTSGQRAYRYNPNQLVRFDNNESDNIAYAADWCVTMNNRVRMMDAINLWIPKSIQRATGKTSMPMSIQRVLPGLHRGKTAVITGGSLGIGLQLGRFLALAGARVLLSARSEPKLAGARDDIVDELRRSGYGDPENRVFILPGIDVGDNDALEKLFNHSMALFGNVDFLINNAGISGAEEMVVDMSLDDWNRTMEANLISNYALIRLFAPTMKNHGSGNILNVSSYFGGEKYLAVAYPNRADYSVSKAGQRVLAEILSRHLGPEIQINAMAPGPVDGARLRGLGGAPGLFSRRGRLILENIRLNRVFGALLTAGNDTIESSLQSIAVNELDQLAQWTDAPTALARLVTQASDGPTEAQASSYLLSRPLAEKLCRRLVAGGQVGADAGEQFLAKFYVPDGDFFAPADIERAAQKIEAGIINRLHLHQMPTDEQVGVSTVFSLADQIVSGETFHPSGGLKFDRSVTEGEMMLPPGKEDLSSLSGKSVVLIGDTMREELLAIAGGFFDHGIKALTVIVNTDDSEKFVRARLAKINDKAIKVLRVYENVEDALDLARDEMGEIDVVVSTPFARMPLKPLAADAGRSWDRVLTTEEFREVVHNHLTHHFRIASKAALIAGCQIVLVTSGTSRASTREEFALALFAKNSLHALTVTLGVEGERLPTAPAINQVQLTRRARAEEPGNDQELAEEMQRLVAAVLQCSVPAPQPKDSRYLARIFRGNAVTV
ncbi:MAG: SDR family NAD(P)-dependent oxidoreductase [Lysobacterales bacterium]